MGEVGLLAAFAAGVLALLSPCSALLLPSFFAYAFAGPALLLRRTAVFYVGLALTLVPLGSGVGLAATLFYGHRDALVAVAGWTLIALGVYQALGRGFAVPFAGRLQALAARRPGTGVLSVLALGAVYGLAGFCSGPVLGAILTMAATTSMAGGALLLAVYALGMVAPLFVLAYLWDRFGLARRSWVRGRVLRLGPLRTHTTSLVAGVLFVAIGVLFLRYDGTAGIVGLFGLGDTSATEAAVQETASRWVAAVPAWAAPAAVASVAAAVAARRTRAGRTETDREDGRDVER
jgi:cytochrome c biogenesis protein CcdA